MSNQLRQGRTEHVKGTFSLASPSAQVLYPSTLLTSAPATRVVSFISRADEHRIFRMWGVVRTILYPIMIKECHTELFLYSHCYNSLATSLTSLLSFLVFPGSSPHGSELFLEPCQAPHLPTQNLWCLPIALGVKSKQPAMSYKAKHNQPQVLLRSHFPP